MFCLVNGRKNWGYSACSSSLREIMATLLPMIWHCRYHRTIMTTRLMCGKELYVCSTKFIM